MCHEQDDDDFRFLCVKIVQLYTLLPQSHHFSSDTYMSFCMFFVIRLICAT
jgi:hypothetical protein